MLKPYLVLSAKRNFLDIASPVLDIVADVRPEVLSLSIFFWPNLNRLNSLELSWVPPESRVVDQRTVPSLSPEMQDEQVSRIHPEYFKQKYFSD